MTNPLFNDFDAVSAKEWKQKIQFDLKGADYNEALVFKSLEDIDIKPFYNREDLSEMISVKPTTTGWKNSFKIEVTEASSGNQSAIDILKKGAESIYFLIKNEEVQIEELLKDIEDVTIIIETDFLSTDYIQKIDQVAESSKLTIYILSDIIYQLASTGNWFKNLKQDHQDMVTITNHCNHLQSLISIDMSLYQNAGATMVQQLAYGIAHVNEYLNHYDSHKNESLKTSPIIFKVAVGSNYFFEIAKLRALRSLWKTLASAYGIQMDCKILAFPSHRNKTIVDYNVNMLRTTTECMSAILGGADFIHNLPYDDIYNLENEFGSRITLNQLLILKNESFFDIVSNPASGSYYIETLTTQLAEKGLSLFKNIEQGGGFLHQLKEGIIQRKIKESAEKEQELFDQEEITLTGTNKYQNIDEITPKFQKQVFPEKKSRKALLEPIITKRLSENLEKQLTKS